MSASLVGSEMCIRDSDLTTACGQFEEPEDSSGMNDADVAAVPHFRGPDSDAALAEPEFPGVSGGQPGGQTYCDDITGAVLDPGL
eukprot:7011146-Alexandrium_andersonii.AAC.1